MFKINHLEEVQRPVRKTESDASKKYDSEMPVEPPMRIRYSPIENPYWNPRTGLPKPRGTVASGI
jgi:hypothetical protein